MKKSLLSVIFLILPLLIFAQGRTIKGIVKSYGDKLPLPGVNLMIKETTKETVTNSKGEFIIATPDTSVTLVISYIGFVTQQIPVANTKNFIEVLLKEDIASLSEVVVTRYGESKKRSIAAAAPAIHSERAAGVVISERKKVYADATSHETVPADDPDAKPGILTAGEIHDFSKWKLWQDIAKKDLSEWQKHWQMQPLERYTVQLMTTDGFPVVDALITLKDEKNGVIWKTKSDNTGKGELWRNLFSSNVAEEKSYKVEALVDGKPYVISTPLTFHNGVNLIKVGRYCNKPAIVDIAFVVDATGSMGDEIGYLKAELNDVLGKVKDSLPDHTINVGSVFYRDHGDEYVTRKSDFSTSLSTTVGFIQEQQAGGGGDFPEAVDDALKVAISELKWTENASARLLFLVLDAPPHHNGEVMASLQNLLLQASAKGIRIIPLTASGIDKSTEYLMRTMALATNGTYVFLTDDSGVGNAHIKPTTDAYEVELLNKLFIRLITKFSQTPDCSKASQWFEGITDAGNPFKTVNNNLPGDASTTGNANQAQNNSYNWLFYPNPTKDVINIELEKEVKEIFITDITGKIILRKIPSGRQVHFDLLHYPSGIYFIKFNNGKSWERGKFILSR